MEKEDKIIIAGSALGLAIVLLATSVACASVSLKATVAPVSETPISEVIESEEIESSEEIAEESSEEEVAEEEPETSEETETTEEETPEEEPEVKENDDPEVEEPETEEPTEEEEEEQPEEPTEEEPEVEEPEVVETPTIDPNTVYDFYTIKDLLMEHPELNGSYCSIKVRVAGTALGVPGYCFFQDMSEKPINYGSEITQARMSSLLAREDQGNNNVWLTRGDVITLNGVVTYGHVTYLGVDLVSIK